MLVTLPLSVPSPSQLWCLCTAELAPSCLLPTRCASQVPRSLRLTFDEEATPEELARLARKGRKGLVAATLRQKSAAEAQKRKRSVGNLSMHAAA